MGLACSETTFLEEQFCTKLQKDQVKLIIIDNILINHTTYLLAGDTMDRTKKIVTQ